MAEQSASELEMTSNSASETGNNERNCEVFTTPESEDESGQSESSGASNSGSILSGTDSDVENLQRNEFSMDLFEDNVRAGNNDMESEAPPFSLITPNDPITSENVIWNWLSDGSAADTAPLDCEEELRFANFEHTDDVELNCFQEFFTEETQSFISDQTNLFYRQLKAKNTNPSKRVQSYENVTNEDILRLVAVRICMGLDRKPKQSDYWSMSPFYKSDIVPRIMTSDKYRDIHRYLHFCNNDDQPEGDRLYKIKQIWDMIVPQFALHCNPGRNVCVDESLVLFKGKLFWKQYIPKKAAKFGIKIFSIADSETGYLLNSFIYQGAGHKLLYSTKEYGFGGAVALELMARFFHSGRCVFADNFFTNPRVAKELLNNQTNCCGTLRKNSKCGPKYEPKQKTGEVNVYSSNGVLVEQWKDKKEVRIISTGFNHNMEKIKTRSGIVKEKPVTILQYNKLARGIDKSDMMMGTHDLLRKTTKWYKKIFFHLVEMCIFNAHIIYCRKYRKVTLQTFKESIVKQILDKFGEHYTCRGRKQLVTKSRRLTERHFPSKVPATIKNSHPQRLCVVCPKLFKIKRKQSRFECSKCNVGLCVGFCFEYYHTSERI